MLLILVISCVCRLLINNNDDDDDDDDESSVISPTVGVSALVTNVSAAKKNRGTDRYADLDVFGWTELGAHRPAIARVRHSESREVNTS